MNNQLLDVLWLSILSIKPALSMGKLLLSKLNKKPSPIQVVLPKSNSNKMDRVSKMVIKNGS